MKRLFLFLLLFVPIFLFGQWGPPSYGWSLIYDDTLGQGVHNVYSFNYDADVDTAGGDELGAQYADTTIYVDWDKVWGSATLWLELDSLVGYDNQACTLYYQIHNDEIGNEVTDGAFAGNYDATTSWNEIATVAATKFLGGGSVVIPVASLDAWTLSEGGRFYILLTDTAIVKLWLLKQ